MRESRFDNPISKAWSRVADFIRDKVYKKPDEPKYVPYRVRNFEDAVTDAKQRLALWFHYNPGVKPTREVARKIIGSRNLHLYGERRRSSVRKVLGRVS